MGFEIDMLPVGNNTKSGDCFALRFGDLTKGQNEQFVIVVDGGYADTAILLKDHLRKYYNCEQEGKLQIDLMILTHPDGDHINGLVEFVKSDDVEVYNIMALIPWEHISTSWFKDYRITPNSLEKRLEDAFSKLKELKDIAAKKEIHWINGTALEHYSLRNAKLTILSPTLKFYKTCIANCDKTPEVSSHVQLMDQNYSLQSSKEEKYEPGNIVWPKDEKTSAINESSIVFLLEYEDFKGLFCGDAGQSALKEALERAEEFDIDLSDVNFVKIPHHGSRKNVTPEIMGKIGGKGTTCFIPCVKGDEGHHPSKRLVNMLIEKGFKVLCSNGKTIRRKSGNAPIRSGWVASIGNSTYETLERL